MPPAESDADDDDSYMEWPTVNDNWCVVCCIMRIGTVLIVDQLSILANFQFSRLLLMSGSVFYFYFLQMLACLLSV